MSKTWEHYHHAARHHERAAYHYKEAAKYDQAEEHEKAMHHAYLAHGHTQHAILHDSRGRKITCRSMRWPSQFPLPSRWRIRRVAKGVCLTVLQKGSRGW